MIEIPVRMMEICTKEGRRESQFGLFRLGQSTRLLIPKFDGSLFSQEWKDAVWMTGLNVRFSRPLTKTGQSPPGPTNDIQRAICLRRKQLSCYFILDQHQIRDLVFVHKIPACYVIA